MPPNSQTGAKSRADVALFRHLSACCNPERPRSQPGRRARSDSEGGGICCLRPVRLMQYRKPQIPAPRKLLRLLATHMLAPSAAPFYSDQRRATGEPGWLQVSSTQTFYYRHWCRRRIWHRTARDSQALHRSYPPPERQLQQQITETRARNPKLAAVCANVDMGDSGSPLTPHAEDREAERAADKKYNLPKSQPDQGSRSCAFLTGNTVSTSHIAYVAGPRPLLFW